MEQEPAGGAAPPPSSWEQPKKEAMPGIPGYVYGDIPNRVIALILDGIVIVVLLIAVGIVLGIVGLSAGFASGGAFNAGATIVYSIISLAVSIVYFLYGWTRTRGTIGMRALGMQVGNAFDGKTLTTDQAIRRWVALWGPSTLSGAIAGWPGIGPLFSFVVFLYLIYLLYSTATSPTKQGFHDKYANTVVVKAARVA
jgi:uncharacterized RDD family membrane protein YckC